MDKDQMMEWIKTINQNSIVQDGYATRYTRLSFEKGIGCFSLGKENKLTIEDIIFEPVGEKLSWKENSVKNLHKEEVMHFIANH